MTEAKVFTIWGRNGSPYLTRVVLGQLRLHIFYRGDADPDCYDHPADFWTFPLVSYVEQVELGDGRTAWQIVKAFHLHRRRAEHAHRVSGAWSGTYDKHGIPQVDDTRAVATVVWWGRKRREWGFHTRQGWIDWRTYVGEPAPTSQRVEAP